MHGSQLLSHMYILTEIGCWILLGNDPSRRIVQHDPKNSVTNGVKHSEFDKLPLDRTLNLLLVSPSFTSLMLLL